MSRLKTRALPLMAALFVLTGFGLMIAALRIDSAGARDSVPAGVAATDALVPTVATAAVVAGTPAASDPRATRLFVRAQTASRTLRYGGVKLVSRWDQGRTSSVAVTVAHVPGVGTLVAPGDAGNADPAAASSAYTVESGSSDESAMLAVLVRNYRLAPVGETALLGRPVQVVEADRADGSVAARFWIDESTGLVLRRELVSTQGRNVETESYLQVDFDPKAASTPAAPAPTRAWSVVDDGGINGLRAQGWPVPSTLTGGMTLYQVRKQVAADGPVVQLSYTDGLVAMSVFLQRGALDTASLGGYVPMNVGGGEVWVRRGSMFFVWQNEAASPSPGTAASGDSASRDIVVSATTDSPLAPIGSVLEALPAQAAPGDGVGDRVTRGVHRVTSWFDPLN